MANEYSSINPPMILKLNDLKCGFKTLQTEVTITITEVSELLEYVYTNDTLDKMFKKHGNGIVTEFEQHGSTINILIWDTPRIGYIKGATPNHGIRISENY